MDNCITIYYLGITYHHLVQCSVIIHQVKVQTLYEHLTFGYLSYQMYFFWFTRSDFTLVAQNGFLALTILYPSWKSATLCLGHAIYNAVSALQRFLQFLGTIIRHIQTKAHHHMIINNIAYASVHDGHKWKGNISLQQSLHKKIKTVTQPKDITQDSVKKNTTTYIIKKK